MMQEKNRGLTQEEARQLLRQYGENKLDKGNRVSVVAIFIAQYTNVITLILFVAGVFSFLIGEKIDGFFIFLILFLNGIFGFFQEFRAEKTLQKLQGLVVPQARVVRGGSEIEIDAKEIVPSDVVVLHEGARITADGKLISDIEMEVDEAILTGESLPKGKGKGDELYSGTFVVQGKGYMQVTATGYRTKLGEIAKEIGEIKRPKTPLSSNLDHLGKKIALLAVLLSVALFITGILQGREFQELVLTAVSLAVAVIPEGLPLVVTISLAVGAFRMAKRKTIVRKMSAIETLGATTVILTDKTGTITQNKMRVKEFFLPHEDKMPLLLRAFVAGNTASLSKEDDKEEYDIVGDMTDGAFLLYSREKISNFKEFRNKGKVIDEKPFDPEIKRAQATWIDNNDEITFVRGAPESIFSLVDKDEILEKKFSDMARVGLRVIGFAYKKKFDKKFSFLALVGIYDPPRKEAKESIEKARSAGIKVIMVTGDNPQTALYIAREIGLARENEKILTSEDLARLSDEKLSKILQQARVFARMLPKDKSRLVRLYKKLGHIVAVTGDGVNDALALSESHIGIAMGETGTDVAKEAADIIITDDNLRTTIYAVEEGRSIYNNIVRAVVFLFSSNMAEFSLIFLGMLAGLPIPLAATQILWVNLVSDGLPALALATDKKGDHILEKKPRNIKEQILNKSRLKFIIKITIPFTLILLAVYYVSLQFWPVEIARLIVFNALVVGEMGIVFIVRKGFFPINYFLIISIIITLLLQVFVTFNPFMRGILS